MAEATSSPHWPESSASRSGSMRVLSNRVWFDIYFLRLRHHCHSTLKRQGGNSPANDRMGLADTMNDDEHLHEIPLCPATGVQSTADGAPGGVGIRAEQTSGIRLWAWRRCLWKRHVTRNLACQYAVDYCKWNAEHGSFFDERYCEKIEACSDAAVANRFPTSELWTLQWYIYIYIASKARWSIARYCT